MFERLLPHLSVKSIYDIDLDSLIKQGIKGIITDLDNTLVGARDPLANPELIAWLGKLKTLGFQVVVVSNNNHARVNTFCSPIDIPFIHAARKPSTKAFRRALQLMQLEPQQTVVIGDQMLTDVLGGKRIGLYTILVAPISLPDEGLFTKLVNRNIERIALSNLRKKGTDPREGH
ncbi:YqeG family HAD IIIA-type phosphatase [Paenibacillus gansuensis]|uniref:YqeG family HAD IIIA-type phosphatase n=1 Tax=Paenibacillus gansuensis TaxID=306542 RepID=A0ABW5PFD9_9BACL